MKKLLLFMILTIIVYSGGDIKVVTPYETNDEIKADEEAVEYVADEVIPRRYPIFSGGDSCRADTSGSCCRDTLQPLQNSSWWEEY